MESQAKEYRQLKEGELLKVQLESGAKHKVLTPFYLYIRDQIAARRADCRHDRTSSSSTYLEMVASLQEQW